MASETARVSSLPKLSCNSNDILPIYDVVVVGSGYGGAIAASRSARSHQKVCVLEKGKEWLRGQFPETMSELAKNVRVTKNGKDVYGAASSLFDFQIGDGVSILSGVGLGGRSLIDAAVSFEPESDFFKTRQWPSAIRKDAEKMCEIDAEQAKCMLNPKKWPTTSPYSELTKSELLKKGGQSMCDVDIEDFGKHVKQLPLWINFEGGKNSLGIEQPACNGCGNCITGCNTGAKNSLNVNYLADAKANGAHIFAETEVSFIAKDSYTGLWSVMFKHDSESESVKTRLVFLAAGVTGTTRILFRSEVNGLPISQTLGHNVMFNSVTYGICKNLKDDPQSVGLRKDEGIGGSYVNSNPGPTVTTAITCGTESTQDEKIFTISDFTIPGALKRILPILLTKANAEEDLQRLIKTDFKELEEEQESHQTSTDNVLSICATSRVHSKGKINFDPHNQTISLNAPSTSSSQIEAKMNDFSKALACEFVEWPKCLIDGNVSIHPVGGCPMGETGNDGVVNHKGQVFIDNTSDVYDGLYVIDSSILPCNVEVSPALTTCILAERCMRLCAIDRSWRTNYVLSKNTADQLDLHVHKENTPGLLMTEKMVGNVTINSTGEHSYCDFVLDFKSDNITSMIELDPEHTSSINGTVTCPGLSKDPIAATGTLKLLRNSKTQVDGKEMIYSMSLASEQEKMMYFYGIKYIHLDELGEIGLSDTTTLYVKIYEGGDDSGDILCEGILDMKFKDFAKQLTTISVINAKSVLEKWRLELKFVKFFLKGLWDTYFRLTGGSLLDSDAPPRKKRPLKLGDENPENYKVITEDKIELRLTRFQGGKKGPIVLIHGLGVASSLFLVDTVEQNFVEYLIEQKYDVWLFDWRTSLSLPWACYTQYTVDECAKYDFPAGINKILEVTKEKDVQLVVHCFGAIAAMASVLLGKLEGKVRCILTSQVCATPIGTMVNKFKSHNCLSSLFAKSGVTSMTAYVDNKSPWSEKTLNHMTRNFAYVTTKADQHCTSEVCHRITFLYGLLFEHRKLNFATHAILHELFGVATTKILTHIALITRKERIVSFEGKDIYLPGYKKKNRLADQRFRRKMDFLDVPIMFFNGERNQCWNPENLVQCYNMVREANPNQDYVYYEAEGYGHLDTFLGRQSHIDIYPNLVRWLDKYADNHDVKDNGVRVMIFGALDPTDEHGKVQRTKSGNERLSLIQFQELDERNEIKVDDNEYGHLEGLRKEKTEDFINLSKRGEDTLQNSQSRADDSDEHEVEETHLLWERKVDGNSVFQNYSRYKPPESTESERVVIEQFKLEDDAKRRDIVVISDLHLGSDWSQNIQPRLASFGKSLAELAASDLHSIVLLGNIFDMTATPVAVTPPTAEEFSAEWKKDQTVTSFTDAVRKVAVENDVSVYYVRGDSDHDMTENMAKELFGDNIHFIPGCLIFKLSIGEKLYTIRLEHGHSADLFSDHSIQVFDTEEVKRPFSYFIKRLLCSTEERFFFDSKDVIDSYVKATLKNLPPCSLGSTFIDILATRIFNKRFCKNLVERAIGKPMTGDECIIMEEGKWIRLKSVFESKFLSNALARYGSSEIYKMLKSSVKYLSYYVKQCHEDVVVMGHIHKRFLQKIQSKGGETIYANAGTWIDLSSHSSYVKIIPPKSCENGAVHLIAEEN